jgi:hypothetical protein
MSQIYSKELNTYQTMYGELLEIGRFYDNYNEEEVCEIDDEVNYIEFNEIYEMEDPEEEDIINYFKDNEITLEGSFISQYNIDYTLSLFTKKILPIIRGRYNCDVLNYKSEYLCAIGSVYSFTFKITLIIYEIY